MKIPFSEYQRRGIVPLAGLVLAAYYFVVLLPLSHQSEKLDEPVQKAWQKLSTSLDQTNTLAIDFLRITNQLTETRQALLILENAKQQATARLQLGAAVRAKIHAGFVFDVYENERSTQRRRSGQPRQTREGGHRTRPSSTTTLCTRPTLNKTPCSGRPWRLPTAFCGRRFDAKSPPSSPSKRRQCSPTRRRQTASSG